jgi:hypothetical protein
LCKPRCNISVIPPYLCYGQHTPLSPFTIGKRSPSRRSTASSMEALAILSRIVVFPAFARPNMSTRKHRLRLFQNSKSSVSWSELLLAKSMVKQVVSSRSVILYSFYLTDNTAEHVADAQPHGILTSLIRINHRTIADCLSYPAV